MIEQEIHKMQDVISEMGVWFVVSWSVLTSYLHNNKKIPKEQHNHTLSVCLCGGKKVKKKKFQNWQLLKKVPELLHYWKRFWNSSGPENITGIKTIWFLGKKKGKTSTFLKKFQNYSVPEKCSQTLPFSWKKTLQNSSVPQKQLQNSYIPEKGSGTLRFLKKVPDHFSSQNSFQNSSVRLKKK